MKEQKKYYSGKKKSHTFKNQITGLPDGQDIVDVITGEPGPKSDITLFREGQNDFDPIKNFKATKVILESHQLNLLRKSRNKEN